MAENRKPRELEDRLMAERPKQWQQAELLPEPDKHPDYAYRWIRVANLNAADPRNLSSKLREGWEPVTLEEQPKFRLLADPASRYKDNVEIGALCTIDAGVSGITKIGKGTKLDNQVHIGHDTVVGENCLMAAGVGLAGCVRVKNNVILWGQVGCASDVTIGDGAIVLAQSGVSKDLEGGKTYFGSPCGEVRDKFKEMAALRMLPDFIKGQK